VHADLARTDAWVIDASVAVEYLVALTWPKQATTVFRAALAHGKELWAPDLIYTEALSALRRLVTMKALGATAGTRATQQLARLPLSVGGTNGLIAAIWSLRSNVSAYDASYVALARALDATFVTADEKLARSMRSRRDRVVFLGDLAADV
jgi:predicted nucleic acid-binding protein